MTWYTVLIALLHIPMAGWAMFHALLNQRDHVAAFGWIGFVFVFPLGGPVIYFIFGINRIETRAQQLGLPAHEDWPDHDRLPREAPTVPVPESWRQTAAIAEAVTHVPLVGGNTVQTLSNGEEAFPAMVTAIEQARSHVYLISYILQPDRAGTPILDALGAAVARGVQVRVLLDGVGALYGWPRLTRALRKRRIPFATFIPPRLLPPQVRINLRNHRKVLVVDDAVGFSGGINIGERHLVAEPRNRQPNQDQHFRLTGPIVAQLSQVFVDDWRFAAEETLPRPRPSTGDGPVQARVLVDGPNEDLDTLLMVMVGAVSAADKAVRIITPYFLPPRELIAALQAAALRGVTVDIILPSNNNHRLVHWASLRLLPGLLERGVRVHFQPPPFAHTKLFQVDDFYTLIGSANLDPRSLRLNFELGVELYNQALAAQLASQFARLRAQSTPVSAQGLRQRPLWQRVRNALAWLFTGYL